MSYFQCDGVYETGKDFTLSGEVYSHIAQARRVKSGEKITVQDTTPTRFLATVVSVGKRELVLHIDAVAPTPPPPKHHITLIQALISEQNVDLILQKTTELGVSHIVLFHADHSPHALKEDRVLHKEKRWQKIITSACEQSGRTSPPLITVTTTLQEALTHARGRNILLQEGASRLQNVEGDATLIVGPEGGFSERELLLAQERGASLASLGPYTLRAETAAIVGVGNLN